MDKLRSALLPELERIRFMLADDFAAVARLDRRDNRIRWVCVTGNISDRYDHMTSKPGIGLTGQVVRHGRPFILDLTIQGLERERQRNPIMLAERLACAMAYPLSKGDGIIGVLIVGSRQERKYSAEDLREAQQSAEKLSELLESTIG